MTVVETAVASDFESQKRRALERLVRRLQLHLGHHQSFVLTIELVDLEGVVAAFHEKARLIDDTRLAEAEQLFGFLDGNLLLKLITAQATIERRALDGQITAPSTQSNPDGTAVAAADVALLDAVGSIGEAFVVVASHHELPFNFHSAHGI